MKKILKKNVSDKALAPQREWDRTRLAPDHWSEQAQNGCRPIEHCS
ncbi:hypothetical protein [Trichococcus ilyis]|nr:hypothetical protein [Trichococcus ilyis]